MGILFPGWNGRVGLLEITKTYSEIDVLHATRDLCLGFSAHFQHRQTTGFKTNPLTSGQERTTPVYSCGPVHVRACFFSAFPFHPHIAPFTSWSLDVTRATCMSPPRGLLLLRTRGPWPVRARLPPLVPEFRLFAQV